MEQLQNELAFQRAANAQLKSRLSEGRAHVERLEQELTQLRDEFARKEAQHLASRQRQALE